MKKSRPFLVWLVPVAVMAARIAYVAWLSPYEMVPDEGLHFEWSRHLDWSYFEHGPGVAWVVAASTHLFGLSLSAIRLPAVMFGSVTMAIVGVLAQDGADEADRNSLAVTAMFVFCLIPAFQLSYLLMTPDSGYHACWAIAAWSGWHALRGEIVGRPSIGAWAAAACAIGAAILFNYAAIMLIASFAGFMWATRHRLDWSASGRRAAAALAIVVAWTTPIVVWNLQHQGAAITHMRGYLALPGGIWPARSVWAVNPAWTAEYVGGTIGIIGPSLALMWIAVRHERTNYVLWLLWCAAPLLVVFLAASLRTRIEGNWPVPAFITLSVLAARAIVLRPRARRVSAWTRATVAYGAVAAVLIHAPTMAAGLPVIGRFVGADRFSGMQQSVATLSPIVEQFRSRFGPDALIISKSHNFAGRISFYLPDHPIVRSAGRFFGARVSSYDFFADTTLTAPAIQGRPALLIGETADRWRSAFDIEGLETLDPPETYRVSSFRTRAESEHIP